MTTIAFILMFLAGTIVGSGATFYFGLKFMARMLVEILYEEVARMESENSFKSNI